MSRRVVARSRASPNRRMWNRFQRNRLGVWSLRLFVVMLVVSAFAEVLSNDKPLVARYNGELFFPILHNDPEVRFGGDFRTPTDWSDPFITAQFAKPGNWMLRAPNRHSASSTEYFSKPPNPSPPDADHWLGTDQVGRDVVARLLYGFRVSILFAFALTAIGLVIGLAAGARARLLRRPHRPHGATADRDLGVDPRALPADHLRVDLRAVDRAAPDPAVAVRLDRAVGLHPRRVPAQPLARVREGGPRDGAQQPADHLAPRPAQLAHAGDHVPAVPDGRRDPRACWRSTFSGSACLPTWPRSASCVKQGKGNLDAWWIIFPTFALLVVTMLLLTFIGDALRDALDTRKS